MMQDEKPTRDIPRHEARSERRGIEELLWAGDNPDLAESVVEDVRKIRENPLVPKYIPIYGYIYDVKTGALVEVPAATEVGKAR